MDGFALSGQGGNAYSGTVPYGVTVGIPQGAAEPADVQANAGADMLWKALQNHGAMIRDSAGSGNNVTFQTDQNVDYSNPLIQGMMQYGAEIMAATQILANQGPHSVNGGGTPIVPLDPPLSDDPNASPGSGSTGSGPTGSGSTGTSTPTVLTPTSGGSIKDAAGNTWTLTSAGVIDENGTAVPGGGTSAFTIVNGVDYGQDGGSKAWYTYSNGTWTAASAPPGVSVPTGSADTLTLRVCEDAYQGDAHFIVSVDAKQVGGTMTASALYSSGDANVFTLTGNWGSGAHDVQPTFINDSYGGSATADRNLYANSIGYDGVTYSNTAAALMSNGTENFTVGGATPADTPPADTLTLHLAEDAYNGNAQFKLSIDGKVISTPQEVTALHSAGAWQDLSFAGNFGAGTHTVGVQFTSDSYGGTAATDRNLYVNGVDLNDTHYGSGVTALMSNGTASFSITTTH
ncbi:MAG: carbohydrate-binding domain-containing protein [Rhodopila sp.]